MVRLFQQPQAPKRNSPINHPFYQTALLATPGSSHHTWSYLEHCYFLTCDVQIICMYLPWTSTQLKYYTIRKKKLRPVCANSTRHLAIHPTLDGSCQNRSVNSIRIDGVIFTTAETNEDLEWCLVKNNGKEAATSDEKYLNHEFCYPKVITIIQKGSVKEQLRSDGGKEKWKSF